MNEKKNNSGNGIGIGAALGVVMGVIYGNKSEITRWELPQDWPLALLLDQFLT